MTGLRFELEGGDGAARTGMPLTWHNLTFNQDLMETLRTAIRQGQLPAFAGEFVHRYANEKTKN